MLRAIIVEDEYFIRKGLILGVQWEKLGYSIVGEAENGEQGIELIRNLHPDLVICDIKMPIMNGLEMLSATRDCSYKAIIISAYSEFEFAQKAIELGVTRYILKPIDSLELEAILRENASDGGHKTSDEYYIERMTQYLQTHYGEKLTLADICEFLDISSTQLNTILKRAKNKTFTVFLNEYRIGKAKELLSETSMKIYEIAEKTGFSDYKYFISVFSKYTGQSPHSYRKGE